MSETELQPAIDRVKAALHGGHYWSTYPKQLADLRAIVAAVERYRSYGNERDQIIKCLDDTFYDLGQEVERGRLAEVVVPMLEQARADHDEVASLRAELAEARRARPLDEWHEDMGPMLWWKLPVDESPYSGSPLDLDWPGYHTHFTPILVPDLAAHPAPAQPEPPMDRRTK